MVEKKGFFERMRDDFSRGISVLSDSFESGLSNIYANSLLIMKYALFTIILFVVYFVLSYVPYLSYTLAIPVSLLVLLFHHELLSVKIKDKKKLLVNTLFLSVIMFFVYSLFSLTDSQNAISIVTNSVAIILGILYLFIPVYMVKAGADPVRAIRNAFSFVSKNSMKALTYVLMLIMFLTTLTMIPSLIGLQILSSILFLMAWYALFIFTYTFWEKCRGSDV